MGFLSNFKQICEDFAIWRACNKGKFWATVFCALVSVVIGWVIFANCSGGWWYLNRCSYVELLVCGNFLPLLFSLLLQILLIIALTFAAHMHKYSHPLKYLTLVVGCIYVGAHLCCLFLQVKFVAVFYLIFYSLISVAMLAIVCYDNGYPTDYRKCFSEIWQDNQKQVFALLILFFVRFLLLFLLLRPLTSSI